MSCYCFTFHRPCDMSPASIGYLLTQYRLCRTELHSKFQYIPSNSSLLAGQSLFSFLITVGLQHFCNCNTASMRMSILSHSPICIRLRYLNPISESILSLYVRERKFSESTAESRGRSSAVSASRAERSRPPKSSTHFQFQERARI